jgi:phosphoribosylformylglycinamidine synthase
VTANAAARGIPQPAPAPEKLAGELGLTPTEHQRIVDTLGRVPSVAELGAYSVMWSEHASYKTSRAHLARLPGEGPAVLVGPGENAGVVDVGEGLAVAFKIESHNHPSYVEPFQGAATGVGGIIRDVLTMGARPIAILDALRFGDPAAPATRRVADGVVCGIGGYGNAIGVPTVGGEVDVDACYDRNPLVNALCVGAMGRERLQLARAERPGDVAVLIGQPTGRDGIGGASVLASASFGGADTSKRPNVQVGDPFAGNQLIEACLQLFARGLTAGMQDMGAAGIACSTAELAAAGGLGMRVDLDCVPLREPSMAAWEILCSESQERMLALAHPAQLDELLAVCRRWEVAATPIGEVTDGDRLVFTHGGEVVVDAPAASMTDDGPVYQRPIDAWIHPRAGEDVDAADGAGAGAEAGQAGAPVASADLAAEWAELLSHPRVADPTWIAEQYDSAVGSATVAGPGADAAVLRLPGADGMPGATRRGVAVTTDSAAQRCALDPAEGARQIVAEAARNVACVGARPVAATNCLNFGDPTRPTVMGAFSATVDGMAEACRALGTPVTGGNVSFYNATGSTDVHPSPVVGVLGVLADVGAVVPSAFRGAGDRVLLVGAPTRPGLAASLWQRVYGELAGSLPPVDLDAEAALHRLLGGLAGDGLLASAHDVADGGLALALAECALRGGVGVRVAAEAGLSPRQWLFSESPTRVVVSVAPPEIGQVRHAVEAAGLGATELGETVDEPTLSVDGVATLDVHTAGRAWRGGLPAALGGGVS